jgi:hypothetical protein
MKALLPIAIGLLLSAFEGLAPTYADWAARSIPKNAIDTVACADTLHATDTISAVVKVSVRHQDSTGKLPSDFEDLFAQEFRSRFSPPRQLPLIVMDGHEPCDAAQHTCSGAIPLVRVVAYLVASPNGTIPQLGVISPSLNTELADSVRSALVAISKENMVPMFQSEETLPLTITVSAEEAPDSIPPVRRLFRAKLPHYSTQFRHAQMSQKGPRPRYPPNAERARVGDTLRFQFTVLPDGRVAARSVDVLRAHYREFLQSMGDALSKTVYQPAQLGGCPVAESVTQTFQFTVR